MRGVPPRSADNDVLVVTLSLAVPLRIHQLLTSPDRNGLQQMWASRAATAVGSHGDDLIFGGSKKGATANVFNRLAEGLAALALCPGGVLFAGLHWCVEHHGGLTCDDPAELTCLDRAVQERAIQENDDQLMEVLRSNLLNGPPTPPAKAST